MNPREIDPSPLDLQFHAIIHLPEILGFRLRPSRWQRLSNSTLFLYRFDGNWTDGLRAPSAVPSRLHARLGIRWITDHVNHYSTLRGIDYRNNHGHVHCLCHTCVSDHLFKLLTEFLDTSLRVYPSMRT